jgi:hypothetical protein
MPPRKPKKTTRKTPRAAPPTVVHVLPVFDVSEACWLLRGCPTPKLPSYQARPASIPLTWWLAPGARTELLRSLGRRAAVCERCAGGTPCGVWTLESLERAGFEPRGPTTTARPYAPPRPLAGGGCDADTLRAACAVLQLCWPCKRPEFKAAFARAMLTAHPDRGGSAAQVQRLLHARDDIERALAQLGAG